MDKDRNMDLYITCYKEVYDYVKDKVKTPEQAMEATKETFEEIFGKSDISENIEQFLEMAKTIADKKCKEQRWKRSKRWLGKIGIALCITGFVGMLCSASFLQYIDRIPGTGYQDQELNFCLQEIFKISQSNSALDFMDNGDANSAYYYIGVGEISLIKDGAMSWVEPNEEFYVAMIQVHDEKDVGHIIDLMKEKVEPQEWFEDYFEQMGTPDHKRSWNTVSVDDFEFYVNGEYILVTYVNPELVESGQRPSTEEMQKIFDSSIRKRRIREMLNL